nr:uncharacterized protein LOC121122231 [Lepeophtheirus salmonis]
MIVLFILDLQEQHSGKFSMIHVEVLAPLPLVKGYKFLITVLDRSTRWVKALTMVDTTAESIVNTLFSGWVSRFGVPDTIHLKKGAQFTGYKGNDSHNSSVRKLFFTTSYQLESNGIIERFHRTLKTVLSSRMQQVGESWLQSLFFVLLGPSFSPIHHLLESAVRLPMSLVGYSMTSNYRNLFKKFQNIRNTLPGMIPDTPS